MVLAFSFCSCLLGAMIGLPLPTCLVSPYRRSARRILREVMLAGVIGLSASLAATELVLLLDAF